MKTVLEALGKIKSSIPEQDTLSHTVIDCFIDGAKRYPEEGMRQLPRHQMTALLKKEFEYAACYQTLVDSRVSQGIPVTRGVLTELWDYSQAAKRLVSDVEMYLIPEV